MTSKKIVTWNENITGGLIKKPCECQSCYVCQKNNMCGIFGPYKCILCEEWRCGMCIQISTKKCNYCRRL